MLRFTTYVTVSPTRSLRTASATAAMASTSSPRADSSRAVSATVGGVPPADRSRMARTSGEAEAIPGQEPPVQRGSGQAAENLPGLRGGSQDMPGAHS